MLIDFDEEGFAVNNASHITATTVIYPLSFFDNLTTVIYYDWRLNKTSFFLNYAHQFKKLTGYVMGYYNPESIQQGIQQNEFVNQFKGPGLRLMLVYNH